MAIYGKWYSSDQIPASFADTNFFGTVNPTDGGMSERYSLQIEGHRRDENSETKITAYGFFYYLDLLLGLHLFSDRSHPGRSV